MWRERDPYRDHQYVPDVVGFWLGPAAAIVCVRPGGNVVGVQSSDR
jgi:hypothetical protein